jgi:[acyl-carrier-protein] S-malonyltransferase
MTTVVPPLAGEHLAVPERMVVAPAAGIFHPAPLEPGAAIAVGDVVGEVVGPGTSAAVRSPFAGRLMGLLAERGERCRAGQPIAWLRVA